MRYYRDVQNPLLDTYARTYALVMSTRTRMFSTTVSDPCMGTTYLALLER
jgi:hypothetical protein